jgi:hypothetical protein
MACPHCGAPINAIAQGALVAGAPAIVLTKKIVGISIILTVLLGPLGMFYSTIGGAVVMIFVSLFVALFTLGIGLLITWPICIVWGAAAASAYNNKLVDTRRPLRPLEPLNRPVRRR